MMLTRKTEGRAERANPLSRAMSALSASPFTSSAQSFSGSLRPPKGWICQPSLPS